MSSMRYHAMVCLLISVFLIQNLQLVLADTKGPLTCPTNRNSPCTALPFNLSNPPDVWLHVPDLHVDEISLIVKDLKAHVSLSADVAGLVSLNAGVDVSIDKVNLTILGVKAQVQLAVYLDNVATIVTRTMESLDLNPLLTSVVDTVFKTVDNTLGSLNINGQLIKQIIDSAGNIVNQVVDTAGNVVSSTVSGTVAEDMTFTGVVQTLANGNVIKQFSYPAPEDSGKTGNTLVDVLMDSTGKVLQTTVADASSAAKVATSTTIPTTGATITATSTTSTTAPDIDRERY